MNNENILATQEIVMALRTYLALGRIASVVFEKKDGSLREATVRLWKEAALTSGDRNDVKPNPVAKNPNMLTCYDVGNEKWININVTKLVKAKFNNEEYSL